MTVLGPSDGSSVCSSVSGGTSSLNLSRGTPGIRPPGFPSGWNMSGAVGSSSSNAMTSGVGGKSTQSGEPGTDTFILVPDMSSTVRVSGS